MHLLPINEVQSRDVVRVELATVLGLSDFGFAFILDAPVPQAAV